MSKGLGTVRRPVVGIGTVPRRSGTSELGTVPDRLNVWLRSGRNGRDGLGDRDSPASLGDERAWDSPWEAQRLVAPGTALVMGRDM